METIPKNSGIYQIQSKVDKIKIYVGSAINLYRRKQEHFNDLLKNKHCNTILQNHANKYGINDLTFTVLELVPDKSNLISTEQRYIDSKSPSFNICKIAGSTLGTKQSEETKRKRVLSRRNNPNNKGGRIKFSEETKILMSASMVERYRTHETEINGFEILDHLNTPKRVIVICPYCSKTILYRYRSLLNRKAKHCGCIKCVKKPTPPVNERHIKPIVRFVPNTRSIKRPENTSGWSGITYDKAANKYRARIKHIGKLLSAGAHPCPTVAVIARDKYIIDNNLPHPTQLQINPKTL